MHITSLTHSLNQLNSKVKDADSRYDAEKKMSTSTIKEYNESHNKLKLVMDQKDKEIDRNHSLLAEFDLMSSKCNQQNMEIKDLKNKISKLKNEQEIMQQEHQYTLSMKDTQIQRIPNESCSKSKHEQRAKQEIDEYR